MANSTDVEYNNLMDGHFLRFFWSEPANFPLWFVRDLMCMVLIFPLILIYIKIFKSTGVIFLGLLYLSVIEINVHGFSMTAIFFFTAGGYFAFFKKNILTTFDQIKTVALFSMIFFLAISVYKNGDPDHEYYVRAFLICGVISVFNLFANLEKRNKLSRKLFGLSSLSFFIYVTHELYIINWLKGFFFNLSIYENGWVKLVSYFIIPILCISICTGLYCLLIRVAPGIISVSLGGRSINNKNAIFEYKKTREA